MTGSVLVVGGSPNAPSAELLRRLASEASLVIACDRGADACRAAGVRIDVLLGDGDSMTAEALGYVRSCKAEEVVFPIEKDDTDLGLAVSWIRAERPDCPLALFTGVTGGRTDHGLAVLGIVARAADLNPVICDDGMSIWALSPSGTSTLRLGQDDLGKTLSVIAPLGKACVSESGMRWDVDGAFLEPLDDLGVSNLVMSPNASVVVHEGVALVFLLDGKQEKTAVYD